MSIELFPGLGYDWYSCPSRRGHGHCLGQLWGLPSGTDGPHRRWPKSWLDQYGSGLRCEREAVRRSRKVTFGVGGSGWGRKLESRFLVSDGTSQATAVEPPVPRMDIYLRMVVQVFRGPFTLAPGEVDKRVGLFIDTETTWVRKVPRAGTSSLPP